MKPAKDKKNLLKNKSLFFVSGTVFIVFLIYSFSLIRPWLPFDERVLFNESLFPIPLTFSELSEIINTFGLKYHIISSNSFFSNNLNVRSNTLGAIYTIFTLFLFKNNAFFHHCLQLFFHLVNTVLVWHILKKIAGLFTNLLSNFHLLVISVFSLIWALHSASTEAVLLTTNAEAVLTYTICFSLLLFGINKISNGSYTFSGFENFLVSLLFFLTMLLTEYGYTVPLIFFFLFLAITYKQLNSLKKSFETSFKLSIPLFIGLSIYILYSLFTPNSTILNLFSIGQSVIERNLWLTPQIFVHLLKLLVFPKTLSLYQSNLTPLASKLIEPYSIFSVISYFAFLILPLFFFFILRKRVFSFVFILFYAFYFSLFPFLHILVPTYCLSADRYCYFPWFFLVLIAFVTILLFSVKKEDKKLIILPILILLILSGRTIVRITEWNNPKKLYLSAIKSEKNPLYKAQKLNIYANYIGSTGDQKGLETNLLESLKNYEKALNLLKKKINSKVKEPLILSQYGLDKDSLTLRAVYGIATTRSDNYFEKPDTILEFLGPYIKNNLKQHSPNEIDFYAGLLVKTNKKDEAIKLLNSSIDRFPYNVTLKHLLVDLYLEKEETIEKAYGILKVVFEQFPNDRTVLHQLLKYYELKNDPENIARYSYLIGLREHSANAYLKAAQIYLQYNHLPFSKLTLKKLINLTGENPTTILLTTRYLDLAGKRDKILPFLIKGYTLSKTQGKYENIEITKSILASLINTNLYYRKIDVAKKYLEEFENMKHLTLEDKKQINQLKQRLN